ncbi:hypothetical protein DA803_01525 [[Mycoplasma] phocae]|uniref:YgjP-like metallopeptidase domain-containing protein n=1 Tax=[Mycoplasma] phocae TaxID=142651 RepID=A0A2Z5IPZ9_9BACT|nr:YgjP-like metallopeptidase domain-containing protein [[Mycoplasma] phocae]AXE60765.1 hypothetical protein DA803_01525 [[Mycoplasma] phocae]
MKKIDDVLAYKINDKEFNIYVRFTNNKNIYLSLRDNKLILSTPIHYLNTEQLNNFLNTAILKLTQSTKKQDVRPLLDINWTDQSFYYLGKLSYFKIINNYLQIYFNDEIEIIPITKHDENYIKKTIWNNLSEKLEKIFSYWANYYSEKFLNRSLSSKIKISTKSSAWATNYLLKNIISVSKYLIFYNIKCIRYVAAHEIAHFLEANHSARFWKIVSKEFPDYKHIRKTMNAHKFT